VRLGEVPVVVIPSEDHAAARDLVRAPGRRPWGTACGCAVVPVHKHRGRRDATAVRQGVDGSSPSAGGYLRAPLLVARLWWTKSVAGKALPVRTKPSPHVRTRAASPGNAGR